MNDWELLHEAQDVCIVVTSWNHGGFVSKEVSIDGPAYLQLIARIARKHHGGTTPPPDFTAILDASLGKDVQKCSEPIIRQLQRNLARLKKQAREHPTPKH